MTIPVSGPNGAGSAVGRLLLDEATGVWKPLLIIVRKDRDLITVVDTSRRAPSHT